MPFDLSKLTDALADDVILTESETLSYSSGSARKSIEFDFAGILSNALANYLHKPEAKLPKNEKYFKKATQFLALIDCLTQHDHYTQFNPEQKTILFLVILCHFFYPTQTDLVRDELQAAIIEKLSLHPKIKESIDLDLTDKTAYHAAICKIFIFHNIQKKLTLDELKSIIYYLNDMVEKQQSIPANEYLLTFPLNIGFHDFFAMKTTALPHLIHAVHNAFSHYLAGKHDVPLPDPVTDIIISLENILAAYDKAIISIHPSRFWTMATESRGVTRAKTVFRLLGNIANQYLASLQHNHPPINQLTLPVQAITPIIFALIYHFLTQYGHTRTVACLQRALLVMFNKPNHPLHQQFEQLCQDPSISVEKASFMLIKTNLELLLHIKMTPENTTQTNALFDAYFKNHASMSIADFMQYFVAPVEKSLRRTSTF